MTVRSAMWTRVGLLALLTAVITALHVWYANRHGFYDLRIYRDAMRWWADGNPLYEFVKSDGTMGQLGYTYPPFAAVLMRPLAWLGLVPAQVLYVLLTVAAGAVLTWWLSGPLADRLRQPRWYVFGLAFVLTTTLEPIRETYSFGQINILLALLVLADLLVLVPRRSRFAGVGIGLATAIKLVPGIFILYLLACRRWRPAAVASGAAVAATGLAAALAPRDSWAYWTKEVIGAEGVGKLHYAFNQSLMGAIARLDPEEPSRLVWLALALPVLAFGLWRASRAALAGDEVAGLTLAALTGSLVSPVTWVHHLVWFVPALIVLATAALDASGRRRAGLWTLAAVVYLTVMWLFSLVALYDLNPDVRDGPVGFVLGNWDILLMLALLVFLPAGNYPTMPEKSAPSQKIPAEA